MRSPGGGELSLSTCPGVGNRPPSEKKIANPRGYARGEMATGRIEPYISSDKNIHIRKKKRSNVKKILFYFILTPSMICIYYGLI